MSEGLNSADFWVFEQLCIKANSEQLSAMRKAIDGHTEKRKLRELVERVPC